MCVRFSTPNPPVFQLKVLSLGSLHSGGALLRFVLTWGWGVDGVGYFLDDRWCLFTGAHIQRPRDVGDCKDAV